MPRPSADEPTAADWAQLYAAAERFRELAPWLVMDDSQLFAVEDPETGEIAYCSVLGAAGMEFGMLCYQGVDGFWSYMAVAHDLADDDEAYLSANHLAFSLADREHMDPADRAVHRALGLKFRGRGSWPLFRSYRPASMPQPLDRVQARSLATCLEQACAITRDVLDQAPMPKPAGTGEMLARHRGADGAWMTTMLPRSAAPRPPVLAIDEARLAQVRRGSNRVSMTWEARVISLGPVADEEVYFARMLLCVDKASGLLFAGDLLAPGDSVQQGLISAIERARVLPNAINLTSALLHAELQPAADALGIKIRRVARLRELERASKAMKSALLGGFP